MTKKKDTFSTDLVKKEVPSKEKKPAKKEVPSKEKKPAKKEVKNGNYLQRKNSGQRSLDV